MIQANRTQSQEKPQKITEFLLNLSRARDNHKNLVRLLYWCDKTFDSLYASRKWFADNTGLSIKQVGRIFTKMGKLGFLIQESQGMKKPTIKKIDKSMHDPRIRQMINYYLYPIVLPLALLVSNPPSHPIDQTNVPQVLSSDYSKSINTIPKKTSHDVTSYRKVGDPLKRILKFKYLSKKACRQDNVEKPMSMPFTGIDMRCKNELQLTDRQTLMCVIYSQPALEYALEQTLHAINRPPHVAPRPPRDTTAYFIGVLKKYATNPPKKAWGIYESLCKHYCIQTPHQRKHEQKRALKKSSKKRTPTVVPVLHSPSSFMEGAMDIKEAATRDYPPFLKEPLRKVGVKSAVTRLEGFLDNGK